MFSKIGSALLENVVEIINREAKLLVAICIKIFFNISSII
ncbi:MAG: hypothetical protein ACJAT5_000024 [Lentimonas sp.]|jgi:hypothetical protein